ncbi:hypothetical protein [Actinosynnema sp. NPDC023587]|uniref:hypothetical protein n=1 Tax=Actinosynnema sp. NPDC023587 TaxID=3154695 RepID=UPI0034024E8F
MATAWCVAVGISTGAGSVALEPTASGPVSAGRSFLIEQLRRDADALVAGGGRRAGGVGGG